MVTANHPRLRREPRQSPALASVLLAGRPRARGPVDLAKEYSYVAGDLKRLGIVAVALFAMLFALRLIIG